MSSTQIPIMKVMALRQEGPSPYLFEDIPAVDTQWPSLLKKVIGAFSPVAPASSMVAAAEDVLCKYCKIKDISHIVLLPKKGGLPHQEIFVLESPFQIGRRKDSHLVLTEAGVSGIHAQITRGSDMWAIQDMESVNGTALNGKPLEKSAPHPLKNGDVVSVMQTELLVKIPDPVIRDADVSIGFTDIGPSSGCAVEPGFTEARVCLSGTGHTVALRFDTALVRRWLEALAGVRVEGESVSLPLGDAELGLFEFLLLKYLQGLTSKQEPGKRAGIVLDGLESPAPGSSSATPRITVRLLCRFESVFGEIRAVIPDDGTLETIPSKLGVFASECSGKNRWDWLRAWYGLSFQASVEAGRIDLTAQELESLEPGDVVLLPSGGPVLSPSGAVAGPVRMLFRSSQNMVGEAVLSWEKERGILTFKRFLTIPKLEANMADAPPQPKPGETPVVQPSDLAGKLVQSLPLTMSVELERLTLTLEDLASLTPGQVISLTRSPSEPVTLSVDGRTVGKGQLVKINSEMGVKILSVRK